MLFKFSRETYFFKTLIAAEKTKMSAAEKFESRDLDKNGEVTLEEYVGKRASQIDSLKKHCCTPQSDRPGRP